MANGMRWQEHDRHRRQHGDDEDGRRHGGRRYEEDERDMRRSYGGYGGYGAGYRDEERDHERDRGFDSGEYGSARDRRHAEDRHDRGSRDNQERYGGNYGNPSRYADRSQMGGHYGQEEGPHRGSGPKGYKRADDRIKEDVCDCLTEDTNLDASEIEVSVKDGEVTLTGTVGSRHDKRAAEDMTERQSGVKNVQNNLKVHPKASSMSAMGTGSNRSGH